MIHLFLGILLTICGLTQIGLFYISSKPKPQPEIPESYIEDGWHGQLVLINKTPSGYVKQYYKIDNYEHKKTEFIYFEDWK